jgi:uncharacterized membrane protein
MNRQRFAERLVAEPHFRWRGGEVTRLEGFSDAVFAFAVTLLVVSLEVPKSFQELMDVMRGFVAFGICFALLAFTWFNHCRFFRRYGLEDGFSTFLNCLLLFFVLFYVYPLKFLFFGQFDPSRTTGAVDARTLLMIYGGGYAAIFLTLGLLYWHAWRLREALGLDEFEQLQTRRSLFENLSMVAVGLCSAVLALLLPLHLVGLAGWFYCVIAVLFIISGTIYGRLERELLRKMQHARH